MVHEREKAEKYCVFARFYLTKVEKSITLLKYVGRNVETFSFLRPTYPSKTGFFGGGTKGA